LNSFLHSLRRAIIKSHRKALAREVFSRHAGVIQRGPFAGIRFNGDANISQSAHGLKIYGLYEEPVCDWLLAALTSMTGDGPRTFVDVGAGDGYYPVSLLAKGFCEQAVAFEATETGRMAIARNAELNQVSKALRTLGAAEGDFAAQLQSLGLDGARTVVLMDVEGAEFQLLNASALHQLKGALIAVELHDRYGRVDASARQRLVDSLSANWTVEVVRDRARDWSPLNELTAWHDLDRAVLLSEGRKIIGEWLFARPVSAST